MCRQLMYGPKRNMYSLRYVFRQRLHSRPKMSVGSACRVTLCDQDGSLDGPLSGSKWETSTLQCMLLVLLLKLL